MTLKLLQSYQEDLHVIIKVETKLNVKQKFVTCVLYSLMNQPWQIKIVKLCTQSSDYMAGNFCTDVWVSGGGSK